MILLLYFFPTETKYFRGFLRCKQKFHIVLQGPSWSSLFLPLLTQLNQFPPFGVLNVRFSSATEPLLRFFSLPENSLTSGRPTQPPHFPLSTTPMLPSVCSLTVISTGLYLPSSMLSSQEAFLCDPYHVVIYLGTFYIYLCGF